MALYIPGYGLRTDEEFAVSLACRAYDSNLVFQRSERTGNYTIFQRIPRNSPYMDSPIEAELEQGDLFPVCAFPHRRMPSVEEVQKWLHQNDEMRQSTITKVKQANQKAHAAGEYVVQENIHEAALRLDRLRSGMTISTRNDGKRRR